MAGLLKHTFRQVQEIIRARQALSRALIPDTSPYSISLGRVGSQVTGQIGFKIPKPMTLLLKLFGLSPGTITVWHDAEEGFFVEARVKPGAPPVYHSVSDEVAMTILKGELTKELEETLMTPDTYIGE